MNMLKRLLLIPLFLFSVSEATIFHDIDTTVLIKCTFSSRHHNRIALDRGTIVKAFYTGTDVSTELDEESGQLFIRPLRIDVKPITISIITENGLVQDLEIDFEDQSSEILILKLPDESNADLQGCKDGSNPHDFVEILEKILSGSVPEGYTSYEMDCNYQLIKKGVVTRKIAKFVGPTNTLYLWEIKNNSLLKKQLCETEFTSEGILWVYLAKNCLNRQEKTFAITAKDCYE